MLDEIPMIRKGSITIEECTKILCYTDGLIELLDGKGISYGTTEIEEWQYHLQRMVLEPNPIDYLRRFVE